MMEKQGEAKGEVKKKGGKRITKEESELDHLRCGDAI